MNDKKIKLVMFDFDGTIADVQETFARILNELAVEYRLNQIKDEDIQKLKDKSASQFIREVLHIPLWKVPIVLNVGRQRFNKDICNIKPFEGIKEMLLYLKSEKYIIGILSSNATENIMEFLKNNEMDIFDFVHTEKNLFGKTAVINGIMRERKYSPSEVVYVGDEVRDVEAAKKSKIPVIAVTWGLNSKKALEEVLPEYLVDRPEEIKEIL